MENYRIPKNKLGKFAIKIAKLVSRNAWFEPKEFRSMISVKNIKGLIRQYGDVKSDGSVKVNDDVLEIVCEEVLSWVCGVELSRQAANDELECYWDDEKNMMVFSIKEKKEEEE
tara:strand:- start:200 stop:541 length:342 start_codon:yes stop_codon:yes gene_type:complete